jgi:hypothetical protein
LGNFPECTAFILIACPFTSIIDSRDYHAIIGTPFDLDMALGGDSSTLFSANCYSTDFHQVVDQLASTVEALRTTDTAQTGLKSSESADESGDTDMSLVRRENCQTLSNSGTLFNSLSTRTWTGLDLEEAKKPVVMAVEGKGFVDSVPMLTSCFRKIRSG